MEVAPEDLGIEITKHHEVLEVNAPDVRSAGVKLDSVDELLAKLSLAVQ